jgi:hypothetical protein
MKNTYYASCRNCGRRWSGETECHCPTCHRHFGNVSGFDRHRRNDTCLDPATEQRRDGNPAFTTTDRVSGPVWLLWSPTPNPWAKKPAAARSGVGVGYLRPPVDLGDDPDGDIEGYDGAL